MNEPPKKRNLTFAVSAEAAYLIDILQAKRTLESGKKVSKDAIAAEIFESAIKAAQK